MNRKPDFTSKVSKRAFSTILGQQEEQLKTDLLTQRFARSRQQLSMDPYRPDYHYVNPEERLNDPNGLCYWQGRYHLFIRLIRWKTHVNIGDMLSVRIWYIGKTCL